MINPVYMDRCLDLFDFTLFLALLKSIFESKNNAAMLDLAVINVI